MPQLWVFHYVPPAKKSYYGHFGLFSRSHTARPMPKNSPNLINLTDLSLSYSKSCLIHVRIANPIAKAAFALLDATSRWRTAHISFGSSSSASLLEEELRRFPRHGHYPFLESLTIEYDRSFALPPLACSPRLRTLHVVKVKGQIFDHPASDTADNHNFQSIPLGIEDGLFPWSQIQDLSGGNSLPILYMLLKLCTNLARLEVTQKLLPGLELPPISPFSGTQSHRYGPYYRTPSNNGAQTQLVDALQLQTISLGTAIDQPPLFNWLGFAPSLISLELVGVILTSKTIHGHIIDDLIAFIRRSECRLETLSLAMVEVEPTQFVQLFELTPYLKEIRLGGHAWSPWSYLEVLQDNLLLRKLTVTHTQMSADGLERRQHNQVLLPRLSSFRLYLARPPTLADFGGVLDFIESRRRTGPFSLDPQNRLGPNEAGFCVEKIAYLPEVRFVGCLPDILQEETYGRRIQKLIVLEAAEVRGNEFC
ncbi:hypothetical protein D9757_001308 [Collybiopsis confluens]|uniref:Uncharacterized protein n=1 Tax=Collybiopsis confluens TaxID=2823264 RepID=A0A8H5I0X9_9AGAR|nr:hypothetical protein D9757_001308 [Collybiopsis confluens]